MTTTAVLNARERRLDQATRHALRQFKWPLFTTNGALVIQTEVIEEIRHEFRHLQRRKPKTRVIST